MLRAYRRTARARMRSDSGATAVTVAISTFVLMGFAAIAIDYGLGVNERRLDQNSADTAVLSAGVELIVSGDIQASVDTAKAFVNDNLDRTVTNADWAACTDSEALDHPSDTIPGVTNGSNCISYGPNDDGIAFSRIRVRVPDQTTDAVFSRLLGFVGLTTSAAAEVQLEGLLESGAFPAAVFSGALGGDSFCIKTGTSGQASCGSPSTGDFGNFQPYFYTELRAGNPSTECTSGNQVAPLSRTIANGLDHFLGVSLVPVGTRRNGDQCPQFPGPLFPDRVDSGGGNSPTDLTDGMIKGGNYDGAFDGRLTKKTWGSPYGTATVFGEEIDNRPLWSYIDTSVLTPYSSGSPSGPHKECWEASLGPDSHTDSGDAVAETAYTDAQEAMAACLAKNNVPDSLFVSDLYDSPRLTIVPKYWETVPLGNNACCYNIRAFVPVFLDGIWSDNGNKWTCDGGLVDDPQFCLHEPGRSGTMNINANGKQEINSASAIVLSCEVLPGVDEPAEKCKKVEVGGSTIDIFINLFLTK